ncbi:heterokaryon incompatibility protein-domain-containing protein [Aspergillus transmontanensis]|uniref:Heterokaryon incompatibility protein-domain-containing protein n=1 Tax=Aspergillus transmontanensis TaxID=1034304 RepID=A0A5N6VZV8_9EURO|nr:heterokaryon incompatibility protein-domain-containing protein [Aspergillus transmontanensis]
MATFSPILRQLGCLRSIAKSQSLVSSQIARRSLTTAYTPKQEPIPLPSKLPKSFLSQIPPRQQPTNGRKKLKVYPAPPSSRTVCKDPVAAVTESQLAALDPTGERKALFDYRRNPRSVKVGDILRVTFKNGDPFSGVCLSIRLRGIDTTFLLRNELTRVGVEMWVKVFSPNVESVEIVQRTEKRKRRARLYYMRCGDMFDNMPPYNYTPLPPGHNTIRMLRLLPHKDRTAPIKCELIEHPLKERKGQAYEALSYVWGSTENPSSIYVNSYALEVTSNLHAALSRLRYQRFSRLLWVDAICIDQKSNVEKEQQIQLMANIYGKAENVIVWLGEEENDSTLTLARLQVAAEGESRLVDFNDTALIALLERPWFRRVWVLQEVGVARSVLVKCGPMEMNGYAFSSGVRGIEALDNRCPRLQSLINSVRPVTYLLGRAIFRPGYGGMYKRGRPLGELLDMYHSHKATIRHDKVFALLGMCCDNLEAVGLLPHYEIPWEVLFQRIIRHVLSQSVSIESWPDKELALIKGMGYSLGRVTAAYGDKSRFDRQHVHIDLNNSMQPLQYTKNPRSRCNHSIKPGTIKWTVRVSAQPVKPGDVVCLLQGASKPSIVRPFDDYFDIIIIGVTPLYIANGETFRTDESLTSDNPDPLDEMGQGLSVSLASVFASNWKSTALPGSRAKKKGTATNMSGNPNLEPSSGSKIDPSEAPTIIHSENTHVEAGLKGPRPKDGDTAMALFNDEELQEPIDPVEARKLLWKIDFMILPYLAVCYAFFYIDKENTLERISLCGMGVFLMIQAACHNFTTLAVLRALGGAAEACADPAFMLITSMWYTRREQPVRIGLWYTANGLGIALGGLLGYGIGHIRGALPSWKYEFIVMPIQRSLCPGTEYASHTKKVVTNAVLFLGYCTGNIAGPFFYKESQKPTYSLGIWSMIVSHLIEAVLICILGLLLRWENQKRDKMQSQMEGGLEASDIFTSMIIFYE